MSVPSKYTEDDLARIASLWAAKVTTAEIGRRLHISKNSVCRLARDARLRGDPRFPAREFSAPLREPEAPLRVARSRAPPAPLFEPEIVAATPKRGPFRVFELQAHHCRYPVFSGSKRGDHRFCGKPKRHGSSYCEEHYALCNTGFKRA